MAFSISNLHLYVGIGAFLTTARAYQRVLQFLRSIRVLRRPKPALVTIGVSHFCELGRFTLALAQVPVRELASPPILHFFAVPTWTRGAKLRSNATPILVTTDQVIQTSSAITAHLVETGALPDDFTRSADLAKRLNARYGPAARAVAYYYLFGHCDRRLVTRILCSGLPQQWTFVVRLFFPLIKAGVFAGLKLTPEKAAHCAKVVDEFMDEVGNAVAEGFVGGGDRPGQADVTFAALSYPVVMPPEMNWILSIDDKGLSEEYTAMVRKWRSTPAGQFALRVYRDYRQTPSHAPVSRM